MPTDGKYWARNQFDPATDLRLNRNTGLWRWSNMSTARMRNLRDEVRGLLRQPRRGQRRCRLKTRSWRRSGGGWRARWRAAYFARMTPERRERVFPEINNEKGSAARKRNAGQRRGLSQTRARQKEKYDADPMPIASAQAAWRTANPEKKQRGAESSPQAEDGKAGSSPERQIGMEGKERG